MLSLSRSPSEKQFPHLNYWFEDFFGYGWRIAYGAALTVVLNLLFLPDTPKAAAHRPKPKSEPNGHDLFVPDAFTNPAHVHFALKVTFAAMFCYIVYRRSTGRASTPRSSPALSLRWRALSATLHKGCLGFVGCVIGGALALFSIVFLMPHMETIASLVVLVACASAIAGWVATGSELISYAGLQIAFAFFYSVFQGYAPDTDLDNVRNRVVGILFGLIVTGLVFRLHLARAHDSTDSRHRKGSFDNCSAARNPGLRYDRKS